MADDSRRGDPGVLGFDLPPDRLAPLMEKLERGEAITAEDIQSSENLLALDFAALDRNFAASMIETFSDDQDNERGCDE